MNTTQTPVRVRVRMYQVGFGDCILLTVEYAHPDDEGRAERHILFDCGTTRAPSSGKDTATMTAVADLVAQHTHGRLDVLVVTHRHKDHLFGFGVPEAAQALAGLAPRLVLRPWTEDPALAGDATGPAPRSAAGAKARAFVQQLAAAQDAADLLARRPAPQTGALRDLQAAAARQQPNAEAIATLEAMSAGRRGRYLHAGSRVDLGRVVPGMRLSVLGPPTVAQYPKVAGQVSRDPEYWMLRLQRSLSFAAASHPEPSPAPAPPAGTPTVSPADVAPGPVRWLVDRLRGHRAHSVTRLVRALDDALNNTSLVLLLEIGGLTLLFPGDAQIENWRYTLDRLDGDPALRGKLANLDLYKVGHHGSRNATPRTLHGLWATQRGAGAPRMTALLTTRAGVHGDTVATAVPRASLLEALAAVADLYSTHQIPPDQPFIEVVSEVAGGPFRLA